jgi:hypothetical protein
MKTRGRRAFLILSAAGLAACVAGRTFDAARRRADAGAIVARWSNASRLTADKMLDLYGPPDALAEDALAWKDKGQWRRIVVWDAARNPGLDGDLRETAAYRVPGRERAAVAAFSGKVLVSPDGSELSSLSDDESSNFLALNLAVAISRGEMSPREARASYVRSVALAAAGKSAAYMRRLTFVTEPR